MDRKTWFLAYGWAGLCFTAITALFFCEILLLIIFLKAVLLQLFLVAGASVSVIHLLLFYIAVTSYKMIYQFRTQDALLKRSGYQMSYANCQPKWLAKVTESLCVIAKKPLPNIYILKYGNNPLSNITAAMMDRPVLKDSLLLGEGLFNIMSPEQILGVVAHEIMHSNAVENWYQLISAPLKSAVHSAVVYMLIFCLLFTKLPFVALMSIFALGFFLTMRAQSYFLKKYTNATQINPRFDLAVIVAGGLAAVINFIWLFPVASLFGLALLPALHFGCLIIEQYISRAREYKTDTLAAIIMGSGRPLINALTHIESTFKRNALPDQLKSMEYLETFFGGLFASHPKIDNRRKFLEQIFIKNQKIKPELQKAKNLRREATPLFLKCSASKLQNCQKN